MRTKGGAVFDGCATLVARMFHRFQVTALASKEARQGGLPFVLAIARLYLAIKILNSAMNLLDRSVFPVGANVDEGKTRSASVRFDGDDVLIILGARL